MYRLLAAAQSRDTNVKVQGCTLVHFLVFLLKYMPRVHQLSVNFHPPFSLIHYQQYKKCISENNLII